MADFFLFATCSNSNGPLRRHGIYEMSGDWPIQLLGIDTTSNIVRVLCAGTSSLTNGGENISHETTSMVVYGFMMVFNSKKITTCFGQ